MSFRNNFIIGLGGAGGQSVAAFRRTCIGRKSAYAHMTEPGNCSVAFEYLYLDSCSDICSRNQLWEAAGQSCALGRADYLSLNPTPESLQKAAKNPQLSQWLGDVNAILDQLKTSSQLRHPEGAEQKRRYGRLLFALKAEEITSILKDKISKLHGNCKDEGITFHIFAGTGGGTGSGGLIDMVTAAHTVCKELDIRCKVILYLYVGGEAARISNVGYLYMNEYATLRDLNALMTGIYHPHMAAYGSGKKEVVERYVQTEPPVQQVYLCSDLSPIPLGKLEDQVAFMAETCFDTIYSQFCGLDVDTQKVFSDEDIQAVYPCEDGVRSYRFATIGTKRWCVPTDRISEIMQLLFRHVVLERWINGDTRNAQNREAKMFFSKAAGDSRNEPVLDLDSFMEASSVSGHVHQYLKEKAVFIGRKFLSAKKAGYSTYTLDTLNAYTTNILRDITIDKDSPDYIADTFGEDIRKDVRTVIDKLHIVLAEKRKWNGKPGTWGLTDLRKCIQKLIDHVNKLNEQKEYRIDLRDLGNMYDRTKEWEKISLLSSKMQKCETMALQHLQEATGCIARAVDALHRTVMKSFFEQLIKELRNMEKTVDATIKELRWESDKLKQSYQCSLGDLVDIKNRRDFQSFILCDFDEQNLEKLTNFISSGAAAEYIATKMQELDSRCWRPVWERNECSVYYPTQPGAPAGLLDELTDALASEYCAWQLSKELVHEISQKEVGYEDVFCGNFYEKLKRRWRKLDEAERRQEIEGFVYRLATSAELNVSDPMDVSGCKAPRAVLTLGLPKDDATGLKDFLRETISEYACTRFKTNRISTYDIADGDGLSLLVCQYWMPARFAKVVQLTLHQECLRAMQADSVKGHAIAYMCNLDDDGANCNEDAPDTTRPSLLKPAKA